MSESSQKPQAPKAVAKGRISKEPIGAKFRRIFLSPDIDNVGEIIFIEVFVPAIKDLIANIVENTVNVALFGSASKRPYILNRGATSNGSSRASIYWNSSVGQLRNTFSDQDQRMAELKKAAAMNYRYLYAETAAKATSVINDMQAQIRDYGNVLISDMYRFAGVTSSNYTNNDYGWTNIDTATIYEQGGLYFFNMPKPRMIQSIN